MSLLNLIKDSLVHLAALTTLAGFFFKEQLTLRSLFMLGTLFYIAFYLIVPERPLWDAVFWNTLLVGVNLVFLYFLLRERKSTHLSEREKALYRAMPLLTPGQFRRVVRYADWKVAAGDCMLTVEGEVVTSLYFVFSGNITITKSGKNRMRSGNMFVGEVAFLRKRRASATVKLEPETAYVEWPSSKLRILLDRDEKIRTAILSILSMDLADKVAQS